MYILILSFAGLRIISCQEIAPNYGASFSPWILHGCMRAVRWRYVGRSNNCDGYCNLLAYTSEYAFKMLPTTYLSVNIVVLNDNNKENDCSYS